MSVSDTAARESALDKVRDTLSDEIEIARAAEQLAAGFVDQAGCEAPAPAAVGRPPCGIGAMELLPLRVVLTRHVGTLTELLADLTAL